MCTYETLLLGAWYGIYTVGSMRGSELNGWAFMAWPVQMNMMVPSSQSFLHLIRATTWYLVLVSGMSTVLLGQWTI